MSRPEAKGTNTLEVVIVPEFARGETLHCNGHIFLLDAASIVRNLQGGVGPVSALNFTAGCIRSRCGPAESRDTKKSQDIPQPIFTCRSLSPPPLETTEMLVEPASTLFSNSSLSALAGRWMTCAGTCITQRNAENEQPHSTQPQRLRCPAAAVGHSSVCSAPAEPRLHAPPEKQAEGTNAAPTHIPPPPRYGSQSPGPGGGLLADCAAELHNPSLEPVSTFTRESRVADFFQVGATESRRAYACWRHTRHPRSLDLA